MNFEGERVTDRATGAVVLQDVYPGFWLAGAHNLEVWANLHGLAHGLAAMRPAAGAALQQQRYLATRPHGDPRRPWAPLLEAETEAGPPGRRGRQRTRCLAASCS